MIKKDDISNKFNDYTKKVKTKDEIKDEYREKDSKLNDVNNKRKEFEEDNTNIKSEASNEYNKKQRYVLLNKKRGLIESNDQQINIIDVISTRYLDDQLNIDQNIVNNSNEEASQTTALEQVSLDLVLPTG